MTYIIDQIKQTPMDKDSYFFLFDPFGILVLRVLSFL